MHDKRLRWLTLETEAGLRVRLRLPTGTPSVDQFLRRVCRLADVTTRAEAEVAVFVGRNRQK